MNITYIRLLQAIELFAREHLQIRRFASDFPEQLPNFGTESEAYPILFVSPSASIFSKNVTTFQVTLYCFDVIQKDRGNINSILSDTHSILNDATMWLRDAQLAGIDVTVVGTAEPINNSLLDYVAGWSVTLTLDVDTYTVCDIPFENQPTVTSICNDISFGTALTCDTLPECPVIIEIEQDIQDINDRIDDLVISGGTFHCGMLDDCPQIEQIQDDIDSLSGITMNLQDQIDAISQSGSTFNCDMLSGCTIITDIQDDIEELSGITININNDIDNIYEDIVELSGTTISLQDQIDALSGGTGGSGGQTAFFSWKYSTNTSASDPGNGFFRGNSAIPSGVTQLYIDDITSNNQIDISTLFESISGEWSIYIQQRNDASKWVIYSTSTPYVDNTGWWTVPVTYVESGLGGGLTSNTDCLFAFINKNGENINLQFVTDNGNQTTNAIEIHENSLFIKDNLDVTRVEVNQDYIKMTDTVNNVESEFAPDYLRFTDSDGDLINVLQNPNQSTSFDVYWPASGGTIALITDVDGKITQTITNGDTTHAPSGDAVFDALALKEDKANKGVANGYASLDSGGKVPISQLPSSIMEYKGVYNALTNTPTLVDGVGDQGDVYRVTVAGPGVNSLNFVVGDYVIYNGTVWEKAHSGADNVTSVFGRAGAVVAVSGDYTASQVTNVPFGNISATDVQAALNELETEKMSGAGTVNTLPKFTSANVVGDSRVSDNGSFINIFGVGQIYGNADDFNIGMGQHALSGTTTGSFNSAFGWGALARNVNGPNNSAFGGGALQNMNAAFGNTAVGVQSLESLTDGNYNTAIGTGAFQYLSTSGIVNNRNIALGMSAGKEIAVSVPLTSASDSIFIGNETRALGTFQTNQIVIGTDVTGLGSNSTSIGNGNTIITGIYGRTLIGTSTLPSDDATNQLQVGGYSMATGYRTPGGNVNQFLKANGDVETRIFMGDTGALTFGGTTIASATGLTINIGACTGVIVDNETNPSSPNHTLVNYAGESNKVVTTASGGTGTYVLLNAAGVIVLQNTFPTSAQRKTHIYLSKISHPTNTVLQFALNEVDFVTSPLAQFRDVFQVIQYMRSGINASGNSGLTINTTNGSILGNGINFVTDDTNPNNETVTAGAPRDFLLLNQSGAAGSFVTAIDPANYDVGGVTTAIGGSTNNSTIQYLYYAPGVGFAIQRGQTVYPSLTDAIAAVGRESFTVRPNLVNNSILIAAICLRRSTTNMNDTAFARILMADKFGQLGGASAGVSVTTLGTAYLNSVQPQITTDTTRGAVQIKRGSSADTDAILQGVNGAGTTTWSIDGNGNVSDNPQISITTGSNMSTTTTDSAGRTQQGRNVIIANGASAINYTCNGTDGFVVSIMKTGSAAITFVAGSGRTIVQMNSTLSLNGIAGSTAAIMSVGTVDYLYITNY